MNGASSPGWQSDERPAAPRPVLHRAVLKQTRQALSALITPEENLRSAKFRILVVEDETALANRIAWAIEDAGYSVVGPERTVDTALRTLNRFRVDLAILDVILEQQKMFPVAAALAAKGLPFVLLTGSSAGFLPPEYRDRPTVAKPYRLAEIVAQVGRALEDTRVA